MLQTKIVGTAEMVKKKDLWHKAIFNKIASLSAEKGVLKLLTKEDSDRYCQGERSSTIALEDNLHSWSSQIWRTLRANANADSWHAATMKPPMKMKVALQQVRTLLR